MADLHLNIPPVANELVVTSPDIKEGRFTSPKFLSAEFGIPGGEGVSPEIHWQGAPADTKSFVVQIFDLSAPSGSGFWHWVVVNIPATVHHLAQNAGTEDNANLPKGALQMPNDVRSHRYIGPAPLIDHGSHRYVIIVSALDVEKVAVPADATPAFLGVNLYGRVLARGMLTFEVSLG